MGVLKAEPTDTTVTNFGRLLVAVCAIPPFFVAFLAFKPLSKFVLEPDGRARALRMIAACFRRLGRLREFKPTGALQELRIRSERRSAKVAPAEGRLSRTLTRGLTRSSRLSYAGQ